VEIIGEGVVVLLGACAAMKRFLTFCLGKIPVSVEGSHEFNGLTYRVDSASVSRFLMMSFNRSSRVAGAARTRRGRGMTMELSRIT